MVVGKGSRVEKGIICCGRCGSEAAGMIRLPASILDVDWEMDGCPYQGQRVAEQHEAWRVIRQVFCYLVEALVHRLVVILANLMCGLVDQVCHAVTCGSARQSVSVPTCLGDGNGRSHGS